MWYDTRCLTVLHSIQQRISYSSLLILQSISQYCHTDYHTGLLLWRTQVFIAFGMITL